MQVVKKRNFYYLVHSYRQDGITKNYQVYIGKEAPNQDQIENFAKNYIKQRWHNQIEYINQVYRKNIEKTSKTINEKNLRAFGVSFTHNTNKIEGSTLSRTDTRMILEDGIVPANSHVTDVFETKAHMKIYLQAMSYKQFLSLDLILKWHYELFRETKPDQAGSIRNSAVFISGSKYIPPKSRYEIDLLLNELFDWYQKGITNNVDPVYIAAVFHFRFVSIHPFEDGNGRITRLIMNYILYHNNCMMFDLNPKERKTYYNALERSNLKNDEIYFLGWFYPKYIQNTSKTLKQLNFI